MKSDTIRQNGNNLQLVSAKYDDFNEGESVMSEKGIYKRKDGRWEARLSLGKNKLGKRLNRSFYGKTADEAAKKMLSFKRTLFSDNITEMTVRELCYEWLGVVQSRIKPSTCAFATNAIELGFDVKTLSEILGHSKVEITLNRYVHSSMDRKRACMELVKCTA